jgi:alpha-N-arabinofuranosidase
MLTTTIALTVLAAGTLQLSTAERVRQPRGPIFSRQTEGSEGLTAYINGTNSSNAEVGLSISTKGEGRNKTSALLYGWMIEDISHSIDGGLYGELITNRAFQGSGYKYETLAGFNPKGENNYLVPSKQDNDIIPTAPVPTGYRSIGGARLTLDNFHPLTPELPVVMRVDIPLNATGEVGFLNEGYWGIGVIPQTYNASFFVLPYQPRGNYSTLSGINVSLRSNLTDDIFATTKIPVGNLSGFEYTHLSGQIKNTKTAPNSNNTFAVTFDASEVAGATFYFNLVSLFGETFKDRPNGIRKDLGQNLYDLNPKFLRFPGGNNIEGESYATRWIWNETIGPLEHRRGRQGDWGYYNTNGFGLLEYLEWTEDMEMERVLAIYAGYSLDQTSVPEDRIDDLILQSALDELEFCMGNTTTYWGSKRAEYGHPEPFNINFVELGNEDWFSSTYPYRFPILYNGIKAKYPDIKLISTAFNEAAKSFNYTIDLPKGSMWDRHHYEEPHFYLEQFDFYDNWQESTNNSDVQVMLGEYSVFQIDTPDGMLNYSFPPDTHVFYPRLLSAVAEGVYLVGAERNPEVITMTSYAPSLANKNSENWTPNLITFTANPNDTILSTSYYLQSMLNHHRGTETLPVENTKGHLNPLWWASQIDETLNAVYLKVVNSGNQTVPLSVDIDATYFSVNGTILTNPDLQGFNYFNNQTAIVPRPIEGLMSNSTSGNGTFQWSVPAYSVSVLQFDL